MGRFERPRPGRTQADVSHRDVQVAEVEDRKVAAIANLRRKAPGDLEGCAGSMRHKNRPFRATVRAGTQEGHVKKRRNRTATKARLAFRLPVYVA